MEDRITDRSPDSEPRRDEPRFDLWIIVVVTGLLLVGILAFGGLAWWALRSLGPFLADD
jgi:hypothetical protein